MPVIESDRLQGLALKAGRSGAIAEVEKIIDEYFDGNIYEPDYYSEEPRQIVKLLPAKKVYEELKKQIHEVKA